MTASHCLSVFIGCPHSPTQLAAGPCLVVNAESIDQNEWLSEESFFTHRRIGSDERLITIDKTVISAYDQELVEWHIFSDNRFNGPWNLSDFTDQFPNLRLTSSKKIEAVTLYSILNKQKILADPFSTYQLFIRQGDPLIILQSAREWLVRCVSISLHGLICSPRTYSSCEAYLKLCGFCQSDVDSSVWHPHFENSAFHLSLIRTGLLELFNADAYRKLYPEMKENTDNKLMNHWLMQPNFSEIADEMQKTMRNQLDQDGLLALFNAEAYRKLYPEKKENTDDELMNHWLMQPNFSEIADEMQKTMRNQLDQDGLLALFNAEAYRKLYPEMKENTDDELMNHWLMQPNFSEIADEIQKTIRNQLDQDGLLALFNAEAYRKLYPEMKENTDDELMNHWLMQPNFSEIADEMQKTIRNQLDQDGLLALFNAEAYRKLCPEMKENTDAELMNHWLKQPDYYEISKNICDAVRCQPVQLSELTDKDPALKLILHTFPFDFYRKIRPDLSHLPDKDLFIHFWQFGRHEGVDLSESYVSKFLLENAQKDYDLQIKNLSGRVRELENLLSLANAQICSMQELIIRSQNIGVINA